jgi:SAM-dependent methyltransferase
VKSDKPVADGNAFDSFYFAHCCGKPYVRDDEWLAFFGGIADRIVADFRPRRALDAGCAFGFLVEALRNRGVEAFGIDLSPYAIEHAHESVKPYCRVGSVTGPLGGPYDLIVSIEVVEHMEARDAETAIKNFCSQTDDLLLSSSPLDYREPTHLNVQPPEVWAEHLARHGFFRDVDYDASFITPWAGRFRKTGEPIHRLVRQYERRYWLLKHEASEARAYSLEVQGKLGEAERARDALNLRLTSSSSALEEAERTRSAMNLELASSSSALAEARQTIARMESSKAWRLRGAWIRVRNAMRRPRTDR